MESMDRLFWLGLATGLAVYVPHLIFFWGIFKIAAVVLWLILSSFLAIFLVLARASWKRWGCVGLALSAPFLWTGLEYFRGELFKLKFTWLSAGFAFSGSPQMPWIAKLGLYGIGFVLMASASVVYLLPAKLRVGGIAMVVGLLLIPWPHGPEAKPTGLLRVAGVQLEGASVGDILSSLDKLIQRYPSADLLVLSEYSFDSPIPSAVRDWCRDHHKYLIAGGEDPVAGGNYYDTAFVVGPNGEIVFKQAKCVPIQLFKDGLPAQEQSVWDSPWGKIGLGICYDASYRRVVDELIRQGAQVLIFPTMDIIAWGAQEHRLNALVAPFRAAEYGVPLFRLASSGISEAVNPDGTIQTSADFPGDGEMLYAEFQLPDRGRLPLDNWITPICVAITAVLVFWQIFSDVSPRFHRKRAIPAAPANS
jgi:apolipoprotein N-acyltransferase